MKLSFKNILPILLIFTLLILFAGCFEAPLNTLTMAVNPAGGGTTNPPVGAHPGYAANQVVSISATPATGYQFVNWSGAVTGSVNPTTVTMNADKTVTANFELAVAVGDLYGGGTVAYILVNGDTGYDPNVKHGLIAATVAALPWSWSNIIDTSVGTTGLKIGTGQANTTAIVSQVGCSSGAAWFCNGLTEGGYSDWYLPSRDELEKLFINRVSIGGFPAGFYWSSSEYDSQGAFNQNFSTGLFATQYKFWNLRSVPFGLFNHLPI